MPSRVARLPVRTARCALVLMAASASTATSAASADASTADALQRDLVAILECRASTHTLQAVGQTLRAAMYADAQQRPAHLRGWRFERGSEEDDPPATTIDMPVALTAHGITTARLVADDLGLSIPIDAAARARMVDAHGLRLRSSTLREPFQVWALPSADAAGSAPATIVVRSDGDGYRLGCDYPGPAREQRIPARLRDTASAPDLVAALACQADDAAMQRIANTWERVAELSPLAWPDNVRAVAQRDYLVADEVLTAHAIELEAPVQLHGFPVQVVSLAFGGYLAAEMGQAPLEQLLAATGMGEPQRRGDGFWMREVAREHFPGRAFTGELSVLATDSGTALAGCMSSSLHTTLPTPQR